MICDSFYEIGGAHAVCQDYALHGQIDDLSFVIVADGCSTAKHSEIGSQMLCHVAKYFLELFYKTGLFNECNIHTLRNVLGSSIVRRVDELRKLYPITPKALEATLLIAVRIGLKTYAFGWGDGTFIYKLKSFEYGDEYFQFVDFEYPRNAPCYLIYNRKVYMDALKKTGIDDPMVTRRVYTSNRDPLIEEYQNYADKSYIFEHEDTTLLSLQSITICSDGISSYMDDDKEPIELLTMVPEFSNFKTTSGEFVQRRMQFLKRTCLDKGWTHYDDVGCGTIIYSDMNEKTMKNLMTLKGTHETDTKSTN